MPMLSVKFGDDKYWILVKAMAKIAAEKGAEPTGTTRSYASRSPSMTTPRKRGATEAMKYYRLTLTSDVQRGR